MKQKLAIPDGYSAAVLHSHSDYSDGLVSAESLIKSAALAGVKVLAITDHDRMERSDKLQKIGSEFGVEIIAGQEIQTSLPRGLHVVGLFLKEGIAHSKPVAWTINKIREQGGLAIIAHPMVRVLGAISAPTGAFQMNDLLKIVGKVRFDAIEIRHPFLRTSDRIPLDRFYGINKERLGARLGVSDSHFGVKDMFSYFTVFPGKSAKDLYIAMKDRTTSVGEGAAERIPKKEVFLQAKKSLVDLGIKRYKSRLARWLTLRFENQDEILN